MKDWVMLHSFNAKMVEKPLDSFSSELVVELIKFRLFLSVEPSTGVLIAIFDMSTCFFEGHYEKRVEILCSKRNRR